MLKTKNNQTILIVLMIAVGLFLGLGATLGFNTVTGTASNYEGVKPSFYGVYYDGYAYEGRDFKITMMDWDVDDPDYGLPDLEGEMTTVFIPAKADPWRLPDIIPPERIDILAGGSEEPTEVYEWTVDRTVYRMEEYDLKWFVAMEAGYDTTWGVNAEGNTQRYKNAEIWLKLDTTSNNWIFEGAEETHFAIGKILVDYVAWDGHDPDRVDVDPESRGSAMPLFYLPYGEELNFDEEDFRGFQVGNTHLNPAIFRNEIYTVIRLDDFGTQRWIEGINLKYAGDTAVWEFTVKVFVVGKWTLQDVQDETDLVEGGYGKTVKTTTTGIQYTIPWEDIFDFEGKLIIFLIGIAIIIGTGIIGYGFVQGYAGGLARRGEN